MLWCVSMINKKKKNINIKEEEEEVYKKENVEERSEEM